MNNLSCFYPDEPYKNIQIVREALLQQGVDKKKVDKMCSSHGNLYDDNAGIVRSITAALWELGAPLFNLHGIPSHTLNEENVG